MALTASGAAACIPARPWPAERVEVWTLERLIPYSANARLHSEADINKIVASILKWGWTNPALVDEHGVLIAGHLRVAAAARLELKSIPVIDPKNDRLLPSSQHWPPRHLCVWPGRNQRARRIRAVDGMIDLMPPGLYEAVIT